MSSNPESKLVLVDGATGYLGAHLVHALNEHKYKIRCLVRHNTNPSNLEYLNSVGCEIFTANERAFEGVNYAVHLVGSIAPSRKETFAQLHQDMTKVWVENCQSANIEKAILVTALGTNENSPSAYHQTKRESEKVLQKSSLNHAILRPSLLIGHQVSKRHSKLVKRLLEMIATKPKVPLIHGGTNKIQPLFIGDMAKCIIETFDKEITQPLDLAGPEILTLAKLVDRLSALLDKRARIASINPMLGMAIASLLSLVQDVPILSKDQVILAQMDNIASEEANGVNMLLGQKGTSLDQSIQTYKGTELLRELKQAKA
ncbi:MAG: NAD(P)H-binding protein [Candidatus Melainabacteria bacterium]|nr:MAG: NAD(P)H-binding protein [Candidatus Melainabacteria bacterium]